MSDDEFGGDMDDGDFGGDDIDGDDIDEGDMEVHSVEFIKIFLPLYQNSKVFSTTPN